MAHMETAIILAGGKSSRMGFDKQFLKLQDKYVIEIIAEKPVSYTHLTLLTIYSV